MAEEITIQTQDWLPAGQTVKKGDPFLPFGNDAYRLGISDAGNAIVLDREGKAIWQTLTGGGASLTFRPDGELELRDGSGDVLWYSFTTPAETGTDIFLQVTDDGDAVVTGKAPERQQIPRDESRWDQEWRHIEALMHYNVEVDPAPPRKVMNGREVLWSGREALTLERERLEQGRLNHDRTLGPKQVLRSPNGRFVLALSAEGGMVVKTASEGKTVWTLGVQADQIGHLATQPDGSLTLRTADGEILWETGRYQPGIRDKRHLVLNDDGELSFFQRDTLIWGAGSAPRLGRLPLGGRLGKGESLQSPGGNAVLTLKEDGNLVLADAKGKVLWMTGLVSPRIHQLVMQQVGNLELLDEEGRRVWESGTTQEGSPHRCAYSLKVDDDGTISVSAPAGEASWRSGTTAPDRLNPGQGLLPGDALVSAGGGRLEVRRDGRLVLLNRSGREIWSAGTPGTTLRGLSLGTDKILALIAGDGSRIWSHAAPSGDVRLEGEVLRHGNEFIACPTSLVAGEVLDRTSRLVSSNGAWELKFRDDGALSLRRYGDEMWTNGVADAGAATMSLDETDGLVVRDSANRPIWRGTTQAPMLRKGKAARLELEGQGDLKVFSAEDGTLPLWQAPRLYMFAGYRPFTEHDLIASPNGRYHAFIGEDGDFKVVRAWDSHVILAGKHAHAMDRAHGALRKKIASISYTSLSLGGGSDHHWIELTAHYYTSGTSGGQGYCKLGTVSGWDGSKLALTDDGRLITPSGKGVEWAEKVAVDNANRGDLFRTWTQAIPEAGRAVPTALPLGSAVFAAARGVLVKFDARDGTPADDRVLNGAGDGQVSLAASEAGLFAGADGQVWGFSPETLEGLWPALELPEGGGVTALLAVGNQLVVAPEGFLYCINAKTSEIESSNPLEGMGHREVRLTTCSDRLFAGTSGHVWGFPLDSFDAEEWKTPLPDGGSSVTSVLAAGEDVFAAANGVIHRLSQETGERLAQNSLRGLGNHEARLAHADGTLYVGMNGQVPALDDQSLNLKWTADLKSIGNALVNPVVTHEDVLFGLNGHICGVDPKSNGTAPWHCLLRPGTTGEVRLIPIGKNLLVTGQGEVTYFER